MCVADRCYTPLDDAGCTFTTAWTCDENADLSTADLSGCDLVNISFMGSALSAGPSGPATNFDGANLTGALFLTQFQVNAANGDDSTILPAGLRRPSHWSGTRHQPPRR